jgi:hypothetical protein
MPMNSDEVVAECEELQQKPLGMAALETATVFPT